MTAMQELIERIKLSEEKDLKFSNELARLGLENKMLRKGISFMHSFIMHEAKMLLEKEKEQLEEQFSKGYEEGLYDKLNK